MTCSRHTLRSINVGTSSAPFSLSKLKKDLEYESGVRKISAIPKYEILEKNLLSITTTTRTKEKSIIL